MLGGKVVSATTDGFITDIKDFESKIIKHPLFKWSLFNEYRKEHKEILEQKHAGRGVLSWSTRGQVSAGSKILAATGFQKGGYSLEEVEKLFMTVDRDGDGCWVSPIETVKKWERYF